MISYFTVPILLNQTIQVRDSEQIYHVQNLLLDRSIPQLACIKFSSQHPI